MVERRVMVVILATSSSRQLGSRPLELCSTVGERW